ncbi:hypothetical protein [Cellulomonas triticagri]|uniref:Uncharacterized protein n=1 Tax=Cellulomonas triticagri TaxID=2483352 RepID=A0A3M2JNP7_9CELL|nr:hypothetical protein [Cellulomonas triticagri]RMI13243.1 hypothetical protein EBM89_05310 [Cellulomonas triticagri]
MPEFADWLFAPVDWMARLVEGDVPADLRGIIVLFAFSSFLVLLGSIAARSTLFSVLLEAELLIQRIAIWSIRGSNVATMRRIASRYVTARSVLARVRSGTGVFSGFAPRDSESLRPWLARPRLRARSLVRALLGLPVLVAHVSRFAVYWLRTPVGLYLALGSIWVALRPTTVGLAAGERLAEFWNSVSEPAGVAVLAVLFAAVAVALDHGLRSRTRGRNAFLQSQAATAAAALERISDIAVDLADSVCTLVDVHVGFYPEIVTSAVEHATDDWRTVRDGEVTNVHGDTRMSLFADRAPNWGDERPLSEMAISRPRVERLRSYEAHLVADVARMREAVGDWDSYNAICRQAPTAALGLLRELSPAAGRDVAEGSGLGSPHWIVARLDTARLERFGRDLVRRIGAITPAPALNCSSLFGLGQSTKSVNEDGEDMHIAGARVDLGSLEQMQRVLDEAADEFVVNLWRACCFAAEMDRLVGAVARDHNPRGFAARLGY